MSQVTVRRPLCDSSWATGYGRSQRHFSISSFVSPQRERRFSVVDRSGVTLSYSFDQRLRKWERRFYIFSAPFSCLTSLCRRVQFCGLKDFCQAAPFRNNLTHNRKVTKGDERRFKSQTGKTSASVKSKDGMAVALIRTRFERIRFASETLLHQP
jgi:hypothetical protein